MMKIFCKLFVSNYFQISFVSKSDLSWIKTPIFLEFPIFQKTPMWQFLKMLAEAQKSFRCFHPNKNFYIVNVFWANWRILMISKKKLKLLSKILGAGIKLPRKQETICKTKKLHWNIKMLGKNATFFCKPMWRDG